MKQFAFLVAAMTLVSGSALSQEAPKQTAEGAHRFLEIVVTQNGMGVEKYTPNLDDRIHAGPFNVASYEAKDNSDINIDHENRPWVSGVYYMPPFVAKTYTGSACRSAFTWEFSWFAKRLSDRWGDLTMDNDDYRSKKLYPKELKPDLASTAMEVDWSKAVGITLEEKDGKAVISAIGAGRFTVPTVDLGKRVQFAMEFLRNACDPTAATGF